MTKHNERSRVPTGRRALIVATVGLAATLPAYILLTYAIPPAAAGAGVAHPLYLPLLMTVTLMALAIPFAERALLSRGEGMASAAAIATGALAEAGAVLGLVFFLISGQRAWIFFLVSAIAFARLLLRLPEYLRLVDEP